MVELLHRYSHVKMVFIPNKVPIPFHVYTRKIIRVSLYVTVLN